MAEASSLFRFAAKIDIYSLFGVWDRCLELNFTVIAGHLRLDLVLVVEHSFDIERFNVRKGFH